ncbi:unnamed protein product [Closterium sp. NIES-64]|nr:unnamed protein product [Closterium sp. NIES-64]
MEAMPTEEAAPDTGPDEPPVTAKPTAPKDPPPPSPSLTPSTVRVCVGPPSATSAPKRARSGKWAQSTLLVGGRRIPPPEKPDEPAQKEAELPEEGDIPVRADTGSPALTKTQLREQMYLQASINYETKWAGYYSWLVFGKTKDDFPYVKCSICMSYGKGNTRYAMQGDDGGRDLQTQSFRAHEHTDAHIAAVDRQMKIVVGIREGQQVISDFINSDVEGRRAIRLMRPTQFLCQCDGPISMFPKLMRHLAKQDTPDIPRQSYGVYLTRLDVTEIAKTIESTTSVLVERYLTPEKAFGGEGKSWLVTFLKVHKEGGGKQVWVRGVDGAGRPINHLYTMHERKLKGHKHGSTYADCVKLCLKFARDCVDNLTNRLDDLGKLGPTKLFRAGKWPKIKAQREKKCKEWLNGCSRLFRNKLPGFDLKAAERELPTFCAIMEAHHEMESFTQGLSNFLESADSKR